jgi:hypothetical protein
MFLIVWNMDRVILVFELFVTFSCAFLVHCACNGRSCPKVRMRTRLYVAIVSTNI